MRCLLHFGWQDWMKDSEIWLSLQFVSDLYFLMLLAHFSLPFDCIPYDLAYCWCDCNRVCIYLTYHWCHYIALCSPMINGQTTSLGKHCWLPPFCLCVIIMFLRPRHAGLSVVLVIAMCPYISALVAAVLGDWSCWIDDASRRFAKWWHTDGSDVKLKPIRALGEKQK